MLIHCFDVMHMLLRLYYDQTVNAHRFKAEWRHSAPTIINSFPSFLSFLSLHSFTLKLGRLKHSETIQPERTLKNLLESISALKHDDKGGEFSQHLPLMWWSWNLKWDPTESLLQCIKHPLHAKLS